MKVITVYSLKGGSGKTTLSLLIAQYLLEKGYTVCLLDSDTNQKSLSDWATNNNHAKVACYLIQNELTKKELAPLADYDFVIIDGAPQTSRYIKSILNVSDYIIIPVQPTQMSVSSLLQNNHLSMLAEVEKNNCDIKINVVINGTTQHNTKDVQDVQNILQSVGLNYLAKLGLRRAFVIDYEKAFMQCKNSRAINELGYLVDKLLEQ